MFSLVLATLFVIKLKWPRDKSVFNYIEAKYGQDELLLLRAYEKNLKKYNRLVLDIDFLRTCKLLDMTPTFLQFHLSKPDFKGTHACKTFQKQLLDFEITAKHKLKIKLIRY